MAAQPDATKIVAPFEAQFHAGRAQEYLIERLIRNINTATLVKVTAVYPVAGSVGFVDVMPLVQQTTTTGVVIDPAPMYRQPYLRAQGGLSAIILDPAVGDIGIAVFAQRDISAVASTRAQAAAATNRAYDAGDGLYLGGLLNGDPTQYVEFLPNAAGIKIVTPGTAVIQVAGNATVSAAATTVNGPVTFNDPITAPEATIGGIALTTHKHISAASGSPTGTPIS